MVALKVINDSKDTFSNFGLFRKEAVETFKNRVSGVVLLTPTISQTVISVSIFTMCSIIIAFLCFASYSENRKVNGWIEPNTGLISVYAPKQGQIEDVSVTLGQEVSIGDPLITIGTSDLQGESNHRYVIRSPVDGVITNINLVNGQFSSQNASLIVIWPKSSKLIAKLLVPVSASGLIEAEQNVKLQYDAFPYRKFGLHNATIKWIAPNTVTPNDTQKIPLSLTGPAYIVEAELSNDSINVYGKHIPLKPGMTLSADILIRTRSLYEVIFDPILMLANRI